MSESSIEFTCPSCGNSMLIPDSLRGLELQCPHENCGATFHTPALSEPATEPQPSPSPTGESDTGTPGETAVEAPKNRRRQIPKGPGLKRKGAQQVGKKRPGSIPPRTSSTSAASSSVPENTIENLPPPPKKMSTGTKLSYLIGAALLIGGLIYKANKKPPLQPQPTTRPAASEPARPGSHNKPTSSTKTHTKPIAGKPKQTLSEEEAQRFNESFLKAQEKQKEEDRAHFEKRLKRAQENSKTAQYDVGKMFLDGVGTPSDIAQARAWFQKSADQKYLPAIFDLADMEANEGNRAAAVSLLLGAGDDAVPGFLNDDSAAQRTMLRCLQKLESLGARDELQTLTDKVKDKLQALQNPKETPPLPPAPDPIEPVQVEAQGNDEPIPLDLPDLPSPDDNL